MFKYVVVFPHTYIVILYDIQFYLFTAVYNFEWKQWMRKEAKNIDDENSETQYDSKDSLGTGWYKHGKVFYVK